MTFPRYARFTEAELELIRAYSNAGHRVVWIASQFHLKPATFRQRCARQNLYFPRPPKRSDIDRARATKRVTLPSLKFTQPS